MKPLTQESRANILSFVVQVTDISANIWWERGSRTVLIVLLVHYSQAVSTSSRQIIVRVRVPVPTHTLRYVSTRAVEPHFSIDIRTSVVSTQTHGWVSALVVQPDFKLTIIDDFNPVSVVVVFDVGNLHLVSCLFADLNIIIRL